MNAHKNMDILSPIIRKVFNLSETFHASELVEMILPLENIRLTMRQVKGALACIAENGRLRPMGDGWYKRTTLEDRKVWLTNGMTWK